MTLPFLADRPKEDNTFILGITNMVILTSAVKEGLIKDDDLAHVPEVMMLLMNLAGELRDDLYKYHKDTNQSLKFPNIQKFFSYAFAKGAESAYLWNESSDGKITFSYHPDDAISGKAGAQVSTEFEAVITNGMLISGDVFCDFQDKVLMDKDYIFTENGRWIADAIASGFFWLSCVGMDYGMNYLGFP